MRAQLKYRDGEEKSLAGFMAVRRDRLGALQGEQLLELNREGELELIYLHLQSMQNLLNLAERAAS